MAGIAWQSQVSRPSGHCDRKRGRKGQARSSHLAMATYGAYTRPNCQVAIPFQLPESTSPCNPRVRATLYRRLFGADSLRESSRSRLKDLEARYAYGLGPLWPMPKPNDAILGWDLCYPPHEPDAPPVL